MSVMELYRAEVGAFFAALVLLLGLRMVTGKISVRRLFRSASGSAQVDGERVLLFAATVVLGVVYIVKMVVGELSSLPTLSTGWLVLFGTSCVIYLGVKTFRTFSSKS